jgi:hypothetical protein
MKMVKSLLLGSAAGLVAVTSGQAADMPVKAKPVEYVKICSLYGAGFYYIPGTDTCLKIGGWVRAEISDQMNGNSTTGIFGSDYNQRSTNNFWTRERGYITADARDMTPYGVARGYIAVGISTNNNGAENAGSSEFSANRAFVQWAGFTAGQTVSFFDFYTAAAFLIRAGQSPSEDTGDGGWWVWAYTAQFGNGFSGTISAEERRSGQILDFGGTAASAALSGAGAVVITAANPAALGGPAAPNTNGTINATTGATNGYGGWQWPDVVANLRVDQAWGSAQVMGAIHDVNATYYGATPITGHPSDQVGFAVGVGLKINTPFISQGDYFMGEANYANGAGKYIWNATTMGTMDAQNGTTLGFGFGSDCVYGGTIAAGTATSCQLTTAWGFDVAYEHYWSPQVHQSIVGAYVQDQYNGLANAMLCSGEGGGNGVGSGITAVATPGCGNNWSLWAVGSRLQWDITKTFYVSTDVVYDQLQTAALVGGVQTAAIALAGSGSIAGVSGLGNQSNWLFSVRMHKDFYP